MGHKIGWAHDIREIVKNTYGVFMGKVKEKKHLKFLGHTEE